MRVLSEDLSKLPGVAHAFMTRNIPGSSHIYTHLDAAKANVTNFREIIEHNLDAVLAHCGFYASNISVMNQTHSAKVAVVDGKTRRPAHDVDGQVTNVPGVALSVFGADCVPVLLADPVARAIGVAHSGWKGTCGGVLQATVKAMTDLGATTENITAAIGPCIRSDSYEVGPEFLNFFAREDQAQYFKASTRYEHYLFDLPGIVKKTLRDLGIRHVSDVGVDTYTNPETCFSYRRQTHRHEGFQGNLISVIALQF